MTHYDAYGNRTVYEDRIDGQRYRPFVDTTIRTGEHRFLIWVSTDDRNATGQRKTYRTEVAAVRRAKHLRRMGHGIRVSDRLIRRNDTGFLADRSGSYYRGADGTIHTGTFEQIQTLLREVGYWDEPRSRVSVGTVAPGESVIIQKPLEQS